MMKKNLVLMLALMMLSIPFAQAAELTPYDALVSLLDGHSCALNVRVEDAEVGEEEGVLPFTTAALALENGSGGIRILGSLDGEQVLEAFMDAAGFRFECGLITEGTQSWTWSELPPTVTLEQKPEGGCSLIIRATGSQHELINVSLDLSMEDVDHFEGEFGFTLLMASGEIYSLWDVFTASEGSTTTEAVIGLQHDISFIGEGDQTAETAEDGVLTVTRTEECEITVDDDEAGTATLVQVLTIR